MHIYFFPRSTKEAEDLAGDRDYNLKRGDSIPSSSCAWVVREGEVPQPAELEEETERSQWVIRQTHNSSGAWQMPAVPANVGCIWKDILGVRIEVPVEQQLAMLEILKGLHAAETIVHLSGNEQEVSIWFSGPHQAGDFVVDLWKSVAHPGASAPIRPLKRSPTIQSIRCISS